MKSARKIALTSLVWLTAAMTLVAGSPHFACLCPNGQVKRVCTGSLSRSTGCCCGGDCCGLKKSCCNAISSDARSNKSTCCDPHESKQILGAASCKVAIESNCCSKSLAQSQFFAVSNSKSSNVKEISAPSLLALGAVLVRSASTTERCQISWQDHRIPPPTDLTISLQHLTI
jgi:hypothetical protein